MALVGLFHFEEMVNIVNMKGHRARLTSVKLHSSMLPWYATRRSPPCPAWWKEERALHGVLR